MNMIECVQHVSIQAARVSLGKGRVWWHVWWHVTAVPNFKVPPIAVSVWKAAAALTQSGQTSTADGFGAWKFRGKHSEFAACSLLKLLQAGVQYPPFWTVPNGGNDGFHMIFFQNRVGTVGAAGKVDQCDERKCYHTQFAYCNLQPLLLIQSSAETCRKSPLYHSLPLFWRQKSEGLWSAHSYMTPIGWTWSYISVERGVNTAAWLTHSVPLSNPCQYPSMLFVFSFRIEMPLVFPVNHYSPSRCVCFQYLSLCTTFCGTCLMATYIIIYPLHQAETCLDCRGYWTFDCSPVYHLVSLSYKWVLAVDCYILAIPSPPKINTHKRWDFLLGLLSWFPFSGPCY